MISAKAALVLGLTSLFVGFVGALLLSQGVAWARYVCYVAIPIGAVAVLVGGAKASIGRVKNDL